MTWQSDPNDEARIAELEREVTKLREQVRSALQDRILAVAERDKAKGEAEQLRLRPIGPAGLPEGAVAVLAFENQELTGGGDDAVDDGRGRARARALEGVGLEGVQGAAHLGLLLAAAELEVDALLGEAKAAASTDDQGLVDSMRAEGSRVSDRFAVVVVAKREGDGKIFTSPAAQTWLDIIDSAEKMARARALGVMGPEPEMVPAVTITQRVEPNLKQEVLASLRAPEPRVVQVGSNAFKVSD